MTQPTVTIFVASELAIGPAPYTLVNVRKRWQNPPSRIAVYLEIRNLAEAPFELSFELERGGKLIARTAIELVLAHGIDIVEKDQALGFEGLHSKPYVLYALINSQRMAKLRLDFGYPGRPHEDTQDS